MREADTRSLGPGTLVAWGNALLEEGQLEVAELVYEKAGTRLYAEDCICHGQQLLARGNLGGAKLLFLAARERASRA